MKMVPVNEIPRRGRHKLQDFILEFVRCDDEIVKIELTEHDYKSVSVCYSCLGNAVRRSGFHGIKVIRRGDEVYLRKI